MTRTEGFRTTLIKHELVYFHKDETWTLTESVHLDALVGPLWTLAVVAVPQASVTRESIHGKVVLRTAGALPVAVLCQVAVILLPAALHGARRDLCTADSLGYTSSGLQVL